MILAKPLAPCPPASDLLQLVLPFIFNLLFLKASSWLLITSPLLLAALQRVLMIVIIMRVASSCLSVFRSYKWKTVERTTLTRGVAMMISFEANVFVGVEDLGAKSFLGFLLSLRTKRIHLFWFTVNGPSYHWLFRRLESCTAAFLLHMLIRTVSAFPAWVVRLQIVQCMFAEIERLKKEKNRYENSKPKLTTKKIPIRNTSRSKRGLKCFELISLAELGRKSLNSNRSPPTISLRNIINISKTPIAQNTPRNKLVESVPKLDPSSSSQADPHSAATSSIASRII